MSRYRYQVTGDIARSYQFSLAASEPRARADPTVTLPKGAPRKGVHWVEPRLVAEVEYAGWTSDAILRHASFQGLREDKNPQEVVYDPSCPADEPIVPRGESPVRPERAAPDVGKPDVSKPARDGSVMFEGVRLTHPDRVLYPGTTLTKLDVARYYAAVSKWALPHLSHRILTLVRTPGGPGSKTFYQKHAGVGMPKAIRRFDLAEEGSTETFPFVEDVAGLIALVQMDVLEIHPWGSQVERIETPDRVTIEICPPGVRPNSGANDDV